MIAFVSGGSKNGKSTFSEDLTVKLSNNNKRYYVATMVPYDEEDHKRIKVHKENRKDKGFITLEVKTNINSLVFKYEKNDYFLIDSLTAYVLNEMFENENKLTKQELIEKLKRDFKCFLDYYKNVVIVSDYIFSDFEEFSEFTLDYLEIFSSISKYIVCLSDVVVECLTGKKKILKGELDYENI